MRIGLAVVAGFVVGGATSPLQTVLPGAVNSLANSGAPWVLVAMALVYWTSVTGLTAAGLGFVLLAAEVVGYYAVSILRGFDQSVTYIVFWLVAALVFGTVGGYAAGLMRAGQPSRRLAGLAVPTAVLVGEGAYLATVNPPYGVGAVAVGVLVGAIGVARMGRTARQRLLAPLGMLVLSAIVFGGINAAGAAILAG